MIPRKYEGESKEDYSRRVYKDYERYVDLLWNDYVGELAGLLGITDEEAEELLNGNS